MVKIQKMSKIVKYRCDECEHVACYTKTELRKNLFFKLLRDFLTLAGAVFLLLILILGPMNVAGQFTGAFLTKQANLDTDLLRQVAINASAPCLENNPMSSYCYGYWIAKELSTIPYVPASLYRPLNSLEDTYLYGSDCKNTAILYAAMMRSVGFDAQVVCDYTEEHCVTLFPLIEYSEPEYTYAIVDLTVPMLFKMRPDQDPWEYYDEGVWVDLD